MTRDENWRSGPVLVVEDDSDIRDALRQVLEIEGFGVKVAENGLEALAQLQGGLRPCLILLDLMMPVMDAWTFRKLQLQDAAIAAIPVVLLTAAGDDVIRAEDVGAQGALRKPIDFHTFGKIVRRFCS